MTERPALIGEHSRGRAPRSLSVVILLLLTSKAFGMGFSAPPPMPLVRSSLQVLARGDSPQPVASEGAVSSSSSSGPGPQSRTDSQTAAGERSISLGEIRIVARNHERAGSLIYASGDVEIHYQTITLMAERVEFNPLTKDVLAEGNVVIHISDEVIQAETVFFNLDTERGRIEKASGMIQPSILFTAETAEKTAPDIYHLRRANVTACTQPVPRWGFSFSRARIKKDEYIEMWDAVLRVKKLPVFYLPYMRYPIGKERASGFLTPRFGLSGPKGFQLSQSYYWAMARNMDATVGVDVYSRLGIGVGLEYRYLYPKGTEGEANLYYFFARKNQTGGGLSNSSIIRLNHKQALPFGFQLVANVDYQTSFDFLKEFDDDFRRAVVSNRNSQVYISRSWTRFNLSARASRFETYYSELDDSMVSTYLPRLSFNVFKVKLFSPVYFSLDSSFNSWQYGWRSEYGTDTQRKSSILGFKPTLSWPFTSVPWMTANTSVTANLSYYGQSLEPETGEVVDDPLFAWNWAVKFDLVGPVFTKTYYGREGEPRFKHIIEPSLSYTYDSPIDQAGRIVTPYGQYRFHQVRYGLTNRFLVRRDGQAQEILTFGLNQTYYFSPEESPLALYPVDGKAPRFSEISGSLRFYPQSRFSLDLSVGYNPYYKTLSKFRLSANAGSKSEGKFFTLSWFKSLNAWLTGIDPELVELYNRHQISLYGGFRIPGLSLSFIGDVDYNIHERKLLYTGAQVVYHYQCVDLIFEVKIFYFRERPETQFRFSLGLGDIGKPMNFLSGFGF